MLRVRRGGRHLGVASRRREPLLGERRRIVEVDQIMRDPRMLRLARPNLFQDCRALELIGIGLVGGRSPDVERERVIDLRFVIVRDSVAPVVPSP